LLKQRKTILYVGGFELPDKNAAAHRVLTIGKLFKKLDFSISYIGITHSVSLENQPSDLTFQNNENIWNIKYPLNIVDWIKFSTSIKIIEKTIKKNFKENLVAIIAYNYPSVALFKLKRYCKKNNIVLIADCTEWSNSSEKILFRIIKSFDTFIRMRFLHKSLDGIIVISHFLLKYYRSKMSNVLLLPPLVYKSDSKWNIPSNYIENDYTKLIYAGSPGGKQKDRLDLIINSLNKIKNSSSFKLIIVGITKTQYLAKYKTNSTTPLMDDYVSFVGRLSHIETIRLIKSADFSIFFRSKNRTNHAGFPTKFVESIACGTPVLTNSTSDLKYYLNSGKFGFLLNSDNNVDFVSSLKRAIDLPKSEIKKMKEHCLASNLFHYEKYGNSFHTLIKNTIK